MTSTTTKRVKAEANRQFKCHERLKLVAEHDRDFLLQAVEQTCADVTYDRVSREVAFADNFTATAANHKMARALGLALDVQRGRWVPLDAPE